VLLVSCILCSHYRPKRHVMSPLKLRPYGAIQICLLLLLLLLQAYNCFVLVLVGLTDCIGM